MILPLLLVACAPSPDTGETDTGTPPVPYCDTIPPETLALFDVVSVAGSSNSYDILGTEDWSVPPLGPYDTEGYLAYYPGIVTRAVWESLAPCGAAEPTLWVYWYSRVAELPTESTFFLALDAFYHFLDDNPDLETFRTRVQDYLAALDTVNPEAPFVVGNVPTVMMYYLEDRTQDEKEAYNAALLEDVSTRPASFLVDLDAWMDALIRGEVEYQGEDLLPGDIMKDGLHLNETGQAMLAQIGVEALNTHWPELALPPVADLSLEGD